MLGGALREQQIKERVSSLLNQLVEETSSEHQETLKKIFPLMACGIASAIMKNTGETEELTAYDMDIILTAVITKLTPLLKLKDVKASEAKQTHIQRIAELTATKVIKTHIKKESPKEQLLPKQEREQKQQESISQKRINHDLHSELQIPISDSEKSKKLYHIACEIEKMDAAMSVQDLQTIFQKVNEEIQRAIIFDKTEKSKIIMKLLMLHERKIEMIQTGTTIETRTRTKIKTEAEEKAETEAEERIKARARAKAMAEAIAEANTSAGPAPIGVLTHPEVHWLNIVKAQEIKASGKTEEEAYRTIAEENARITAERTTAGIETRRTNTTKRYRQEDRKVEQKDKNMPYLLLAGISPMLLSVGLAMAAPTTTIAIPSCMVTLGAATSITMSTLMLITFPLAFINCMGLLFLIKTERKNFAILVGILNVVGTALLGLGLAVTSMAALATPIGWLCLVAALTIIVFIGLFEGIKKLCQALPTQCCSPDVSDISEPSTTPNTNNMDSHSKYTRIICS